MERARLKLDEQGSVTLFAAMAATGIALLAAFVLCLAGLFVQKSALDNDLEVAREATLANGFQMEVKNSSEPGQLIAKRICESLRANGYEGEVFVQFYEASATDLAASDPSLSESDRDKVRALAYQVTVAQPPLRLAALGMYEGISVKSGITCTMCPYGAHKTYKPQDDEDVSNYHDGTLYLYTSAPDAQMTRSTLSSADMANGLEQAVATACEKAAVLAEG